MRMSSDSNTYDTRRLHAIMAGSGDPYSVLTPLRKGLLRAFHDRLSLPDVAAAFGISAADVERELEPLVTASLAQEQNGHYQATFFIASCTETLQVTAHARGTGRLLAQRLLQGWDDIETAYKQLGVSHDYGFRDLAFLLVGDVILDVGLLDALAHDGTLMPAAPARPSPDHPDARYYFWMIEGDPDQLGWYGQCATAPLWKHWQLLTFGRYWIDGAPNVARQALETKARELLTANLADDPEALAEHLNIPLVNQEDARRWWQCAKSYTADLLSVYRERADTLKQLYTSLHASTYAPYGFGEFFCWYDHVAYANANDVLADAGVLTIPQHQFIAALWHEEPDEDENGF